MTTIMVMMDMAYNFPFFNLLVMVNIIELRIIKNPNEGK
jgi:hypothetical protein